MDFENRWNISRIDPVYMAQLGWKSGKNEHQTREQSVTITVRAEGVQLCVFFLFFFDKSPFKKDFVKFRSG